MIDLNDYTHHKVLHNGKHRSDKLYKAYCDTCGADRGYKPKVYKNLNCNRCAQIGKILTVEDRLNKSTAAFERYNDPNWSKKSTHVDSPRRRDRSTYIKVLTNEQKKIKHNMRSNLNQKLKRRNIDKKHNKSFNLLGYSVDDLKKHLESKFQPGMSWNNYGRGGWHVDHIIPDSWFTYQTIQDEGFKKSWTLSNLQPMWESDNCSKGTRYAKSSI